MTDQGQRSPRLLVSVRSPEEAEAALAGGADLIDVKEPARGPLGRADDAVMAAIVHQVAGRRPVSAALGELREWREDIRAPLASLAFVKWGLAGCRDGNGWRRRLAEAQAVAGPRVVVVAYADADRADAPPVGDVVDFVLGSTSPVLLVDTFAKPSANQPPRYLLDWLSYQELTTLCQRCHAAGVRLALAGSLGVAQIQQLLPLGPDIIAVRGAACMGQDRQQTVSAERVRELAELLRPHQPAAAPRAT